MGWSFRSVARGGSMLLVALTMVVAAGLCGCDETSADEEKVKPGPMSQSEYRDAVKDALKEMAHAKESVYEGFLDVANHAGQGEIGTDGVRDLQATMDDYEKNMKAAISDLQEALPPEGYEDLHQDVMGGLEALTALASSMKDTAVAGLESDSSWEDAGDQALDEVLEEIAELEDDMTEFAGALKELGLVDDARDLGFRF